MFVVDMSFIRETPFGDVLRMLGAGERVQYPESVPGFLPKSHDSHSNSDNDSEIKTAAHVPGGGEKVVQVADGVILVDWYDDEDLANPRNWAAGKKAWVAFVIFIVTFVVYTSSAIFVTANQYIMMHFEVSEELAGLALSMYVAGYGLGPMLFAPLSEIGYIGRNPPYVISFVLFSIVSVLISTVGERTFAGLIIMRFLQGFFGSPVLASGGASLEDVYDWHSVPYTYIMWIGAMYCGPAIGPLMSAYAVPHNWRWPLWEICIMAAPILFVMLPLLPETSSPKILYQRAKCLREQTGNPSHRSATELVKLEPMAIVMDAMIKPLEIAILDPAIGFSCIYGALLYATYYSFFEAIKLVYVDLYGFTLGQFGLVFLCVVVGCVTFAIIYALYLYFVLGPQGRREVLPQESRLKPALPAVFLLPASLFLFAWSARADVHWIVPTIGIAIFSGTSFVVFQCILCWVPLSYPKYVASLLAANDFVRSMLAVGFVQFSKALYTNLGVAKGVSVLGGLSVMGILGMWFLYFKGAMLRSRSKFAVD